MTRLQSIEFQRSRHRRKRHARVERDPLKAGDRVPSLSRDSRAIEAWVDSSKTPPSG